MSLYERCEACVCSNEYDKIRDLFKKEFPDTPKYTEISEAEFKDLELILEDFGNGELVDIFVETFGSLPPRAHRDEFWITVAARYGSVSMLKAIHKHGIEIDKINEVSGRGIGKETALEAGITNESVVSFLLEKGANPRVYRFDYYLSRPDIYDRKILKMIWDKDPSANEHSVLNAFSFKRKDVVEWFIENGARFNDKTLLEWACRNLWSDIVIFLIKKQKTFTEKDLVAKSYGKSPIDHAYNENEIELFCSFLDELMPLFSETIKTEYLVPKSAGNGKINLPCGHKVEDSLKLVKCPICRQPKYRIKKFMTFFSCF